MEWSGERNDTQRRISDICIVAGEQVHLETLYILRTLDGIEELSQ